MAAAAAANLSQDMKMNISLPILGSPRCPSYDEWISCFNNYCACLRILTPARNLPVTTLYGDYTVAQAESNARCRLLLQEALSSEDWGLISSDARYVVNLAKLAEIYEGEGSSQIEHLHFQLSNLKLQSGETLKSMWSRAVTIQRKLTLLAIIVNDQTLLMWLLAALPEEWKQFKTVARHNPTAILSLHSMLRFLQVEENSMLRSKKTTPTPAGKPYQQTPFKAYSMNSTAGFTNACFRCGSTGHRVAACPEPDTRAATKPPCAHCGRVGHSIEKCFHLHGFPNQRPRSRSPGRTPGPPSIRATSPARSPRDS
jgi:hypothetical protein